MKDERGPEPVGETEEEPAEKKAWAQPSLTFLKVGQTAMNPADGMDGGFDNTNAS